MPAGFALLLLLASPSATAHLQAPPSLDAAIREGVEQELGPGVFTSSAALAARRFVIEARQGNLNIRVFAGEELLEQRTLGPQDSTSATRLAVLLIVRAMEAPLAAPPEPPAPPPPPPPPPPQTVTATRSWFLAADLGAVAWTGPFSPRTTLGVSLTRTLPFVELGLRAVVAGLCCTVNGDGIQATVWSLLGLVEAQAQLLQGEAWGLAAALGAGVGVDWVRARIVGVFQPTGPEQRATVSAAGRAGLRVWVALSERISLRASLGAQLHSASPQIQLPAPFQMDRSPLERGFVLPYLELGVVSGIF